MSTARSNSWPQLADHVRACLVGDQLIFLDLLRSKYIGVAGPRIDALSAALLGGNSANGAEAVDEWIARLRQQNLLSEGPSVAPSRRPTLAEPVAGLDTQDVQADASDWRQLMRLWRSTWVASAWLRRRSLADIADRVAALRARRSVQSAAQDGMQGAVGAYLRLRPFALSSHDRCLNDSLTLVHFLASQGHFPHWVIGVRVRPFYAHSWVQSGGVVLNDLPEHVRSYQPILVV